MNIKPPQIITIKVTDDQENDIQLESDSKGTDVDDEIVDGRQKNIVWLGFKTEIEDWSHKPKA